MITTRYRFYVGLTDKDKQPVNPVRYFHAMDAVHNAYTCFEADGVWKGDHETSLVFEVVDSEGKIDYQIVRATVGFLKLAGNQETVMVTIDHSVELLFFS
jgi:hypothetical protein